MKIRTALLAGLASALTMTSVRADEPAPKTSTFTGELIDLGCYIERGLHGPDHAACGSKCILAGRPVGLLTDRPHKLYLLIGNSHQLNHEVAPFTSQTVTITGQLSNRDGVNAIQNAQLIKPVAARQ